MAGRGFFHSRNPSFACDERVVLLPFGRRSYLPAAVERWRGEEVALDETTDRIVYRLRGAPAPTTLVYAGMGAPAAANALEMARANGAERVVIVGACGGVDPAVGIGDLVVASGGVRGEGTSAYYAPAGYPAACDPLLTSALLAAARAGGGRAHLGVTYTTDASYRQGPEIYEAHRGLVVAVESEVAAAAVVAARLGLRLAALLFCTDSVVLADEAERRYRGLGDPRVAEGFARALAVALEVLASAAA